MLKRMICVENPAYLHTKLEQLVVEPEDGEKKQAPLEDIGWLIIDNDRVSLSKSLMAKCAEYNVVVIITDKKHIPTSMMLPLEANTLHHERFDKQLAAKEPLKKQLWKRTIQAKIRNQARLLEILGKDNRNIESLVKKVKTGDQENCEAVAASRYWKKLFDDPGYTRGDYDKPPNNLLNYGYAILRAIIARNLVGSGLLPVAGIHHKNRYNAYPLADDIMEPFRPNVDSIVVDLFSYKRVKEINKEAKTALLRLPFMTVMHSGEKLDLADSAQRTCSGLVKSFASNKVQLNYHELWN